jgi:hypothetical protein
MATKRKMPQKRSGPRVMVAGCSTLSVTHQFPSATWNEKKCSCDAAKAALTARIWTAIKAQRIAANKECRARANCAGNKKCRIELDVDILASLKCVNIELDTCTPTLKGFKATLNTPGQKIKSKCTCQ